MIRCLLFLACLTLAGSCVRLGPARAPQPEVRATPAPTKPGEKLAEVTPSVPAPAPTLPPTNSQRVAELKAAGELPEWAVFASPDPGIQAFLWWRPETADRDLGLIREMGFHWVKQLFAWRDIELEKGAFDWSRTDRIVDQADQQGLNLMVRLDVQPFWARQDGIEGVGPPDDLADFGDFAEAVASRYAGRIDAYNIWNEPNLAREWGDQPPDPAGYGRLLCHAHQRIKAVDPQAVVVSAGLSPTGTGPPVALPDREFLRGMYQAGAKDCFDALGTHAAGFKAPPELSPDEAAASQEYGGQRFFTFRQIEDYRSVMADFGDAEKQVAILEMGWTSDPRPDSPYHWHAVPEQTKAEYLVRAFQWASQHWRPWIGVMSMIYICNPDWTPSDEQFYWCITEPDGTPRPAYQALRAVFGPS